MGSPDGSPSPRAASLAPEAVALFGTSADPPTLGHRALLQALLQRYPLVATWASDNPLKHHTAPLELRQRLLAALVQALGSSRLQLRPELSSPWAVETLERAQRLWPQRPLVFVIGSDLVPQLPRWRESGRLMAGCRLAIAPRVGWPLRPQDLQRLEALGASLEVLPLQIPASASSELRQVAARHQAGQLPAELWPLLLQDNPYGLTPP
ncbi:MAG: nicotinate-nucleotide adenylyltransferase [Synechococcaceae cyanobacterium]|nr:nicotinate-nucleotide adenylyltransferase [Synechococcaceae cyanobacterium]